MKIKDISPQNNYWNRYRLKRQKNLTIVIGAKCKDGVVLIADSKVLRGTDYSYEAKIDSQMRGIVYGASGTTAFFDKFKRHLISQRQRLAKEKNRSVSEPAFDNLEEFLIVCERILRFYKKEYKLKQEPALQLLIGVQAGNQAFLHFLDTTECIEEEIKKYLVIGHGEPYATPLMKIFCREDMNMKQVAILGCFIIRLIEEVGMDLTVGTWGGEPQIWFIPNDSDDYNVSQTSTEYAEISKGASRLMVNYWNKMSDIKVLLTEEKIKETKEMLKEFENELNPSDEEKSTS